MLLWIWMILTLQLFNFLTYFLMDKLVFSINIHGLITSFLKTQCWPQSFARRDDGTVEPSGRGRVINKATTITQSSYGSKKGEKDKEKKKRFSLVYGNSSFQIELCQNPLPCDSFSQQWRLPSSNPINFYIRKM